MHGTRDTLAQNHSNHTSRGILSLMTDFGGVRVILVSDTLVVIVGSLSTCMCEK